MTNGIQSPMPILAPADIPVDGVVAAKLVALLTEVSNGIEPVPVDVALF